MATQSPNPTAHYDEANRPRRGPRNAAGSSNLQRAFGALTAANTLGAGGAAGGTAASAGAYDKRVVSATRNPR